MKSIESIDKTAKSIGAFDSINYGVYVLGLYSPARVSTYMLVTNARTCKSCRDGLLSAYGMRRYIAYCFCLFRQNRRTLAADLVEGLLQRDEIWQIIIEGTLLYITTQTGEFWPKWSPCGAKMVKGVKNCNAFLVHRLTQSGEIWHG